MNPIRPALLLLVVTVIASTLPLRVADLRAGAAKACITPALASRINGGVGPATASHIHDHLFVRALVLDDGSTRLGFAVVDSCLLDRVVFDEAKQLLQRSAGLAPQHVHDQADARA